MIIPNVQENKKEERKFWLRIFACEPIDVIEMPETIEISVEGAWNDNSAGGRRRIEKKENP